MAGFGIRQDDDEDGKKLQLLQGLPRAKKQAKKVQGLVKNQVSFLAEQGQGRQRSKTQAC
ncbi:MAG: hypothetical protein J7M40_00645 [Planctomycetes bacterium]|nr:hypothetical protein [Planctomycetota bacterium]